jgi:uridylate kinase
VNPADSHNMSMLSTVFNAVSLQNFLEKIQVKTVVMDAL